MLHNKTRILVLVLVSILVLAGAAYAVPNLPQSFYGTVNCSNGTLNGGVIEGILDGQVSQLAFDGTAFGGSGHVTDKTLDVFGEYPNHSVSFRVNGVQADQTVKYEPGKTSSLELTIPYNLSGFTLGPVSLTLKVTEKARINVTAQYSNETTSPAISSGLTFNSGNPQVAVVNEIGEVTAVAPGTAEITVKYYGLIRTVPVTVNAEVILESIDAKAGSEDAADLKVNEYVPVSVTAKYSNGVTVEVTQSTQFTSANEEIAKVTDGKLKGVKKGTTTVTASFGGKSDIINVSVSESSGGGGGSTGTTQVVFPVPLKFKDIEKHWAKDSIQWLVERGIITGYSDDTFRPENKITRAELAVILAKALKLSPVTEKPVFTDNDSIPVWAQSYISMVVKEGIIKGYPKAEGGYAFLPNKTVSRAELAAVAARIIEKNGTVNDEALRFNDNDKIPAWAKQSVGMALAKDIMTGYPDNTFRAQNDITRAEAATVIVKLIHVLNNK